MIRNPERRETEGTASGRVAGNEVEKVRRSQTMRTPGGLGKSSGSPHPQRHGKPLEGSGRGLTCSALGKLVVVWSTGCRSRGQEQEVKLGDDCHNSEEMTAPWVQEGDEGRLNSRYVLKAELTYDLLMDWMWGERERSLE